jgi:hypothetical protein
VFSVLRDDSDREICQVQLADSEMAFGEGTWGYLRVGGVRLPEETVLNLNDTPFNPGEHVCAECY